MERLLSNVQEISGEFLSFMKISTDSFNNTLNTISEELLWLNGKKQDSQNHALNNYYRMKSKGKR
jgi:hypothetical protein